MQVAARIDPAEHQGLIWLTIKRYLRAIEGTSISAEDLAQEANFGLMRAAETFEPAKGKFSTYAVCWIRHHVGRYLQNNLRTVRIPTHEQAKGKALKHPRYTQPLYIKRSVAKSSSDDEICVVDLMTDRLEPAPGADTAFDKRQAAQVLRGDLVEHLTPRERFVIKGLFWEDKTLQQVGDTLGLSRERVRQIKNRALVTLRERGRNW